MTILCKYCGAALTDEWEDNFDQEECRDCTDDSSKEDVKEILSGYSIKNYGE